MIDAPHLNAHLTAASAGAGANLGAVAGPNLINFLISTACRNLLAEGRGLALNSLGGEPRNPSGWCGEAKLGAGPQVFDGARQSRDWLLWRALLSALVTRFLKLPHLCSIPLAAG